MTNYVGGDVVSAFGFGIRYECEAGYLFRDDPDVTSFSSICLLDGSWSAVNWVPCVHPKGKYYEQGVDAGFVGEDIKHLLPYSEDLSQPAIS